MSPRICLALAALFICLCPLTARAQPRRINGYAVQVAALSSQRSAEELTRGLNARGMNAYWVGGALYGAGKATPLYRVRVGNFQTIASANTYAENLLGSGLVGAYAIAAYETPTTGDSISNSNWKIQTFAQKRPRKYLGKNIETEVIDVIATIGSRGWLLLSRESINLTLREGDSELSRELSALASAISSRGWRLNNNIAKFLGASTPINAVSLPSGIIAEAPRAGSAPLNAAGPEIGRGSLGPTSSTGGARSRGYNSPPRLQGSVEMRDGRMFMTLRNADTDRVFSGVARISFSDDQKRQDVTPISVTVLPDKEASFPLDEATMTNGSWILMVYDQNGAARLIRGASLAPSRAPAQTDSTAPVDPNPAPEPPPSYVTGVYDTTNWTQPEASPTILNDESQVSAPSSGENLGVTEGDASSPNPMPESPQAENGPGAVAATLRKVGATNENVTLELDISGERALRNVIVTLRAGDFQDVRQAFIPASQGRVPFLVPTAYSSGEIYYEIKDDAQRLLVSGSANLGNLAK